MKLKKSILNKILDTYSIRTKEFEPVVGVDGRFISRYTRGYHIAVEFEKVCDKETGRILVHHTSANGCRTFTDVWELDKKGGYYWKYRNPQAVPLSDIEAIRDLENELEDVKVAARKLKEAHDDLLSQKCDIICETHRKKVGRPKETEKLAANCEKLRELLQSGKSISEIMDIMQISRATFYRLIKEVRL